MKDLSELRIYHLAVEIGEEIWQSVSQWESFAKWTIGKQIAESADGIAAQMIEGYYRKTLGEQRKFFQYALSSAKETELWLWRARKRELLSNKKYSEIKENLENLIPQTINYILHLQKNREEDKG
jgi:four helix bundle protein